MKERISAPRTVAVVLAGGTGQRVGLAMPKQLVKIAGKTIIEHSLQVFEDCPGVDDIVVFMHRDFVDAVEELVAASGMTKVRGVQAGGASRSDTTQRAIAWAERVLGADRDVNVLFHDAVRPLLSPRIVADCITALDKHRAVDVAIPSSDTVVVTHELEGEGEFIADIPRRARLRRGQTPQAFKLSVIREAYEAAMRDPFFEATDDCAVVLRYLPEVPIHVVHGDEHNMKVTYPVDIYLADKLFQLASHAAPEPRSAEDYRTQLDGKAVVIFGASYGIGADVAAFAERHGARVFAHSRSLSGTYVERPGHVESALAAAYAETGRIDYVVNTAGVLRTGKLAETGIEGIEEDTAVNYLAPVYIARAAHPYLAQSRGQLLLYTSSSYTRGRSGYSLYSSAKAAMVNLTQALADEWAADGIRVNCINPERTRTPMRLNAFGEEPVDSLLTSEAVARTSVDVLISRLTGHVIDVRRQDPMNGAAFGEASVPAAGPAPAPGTGPVRR